MTTRSTIEWTDVSWIPVVGCTPVSEGCANCYASPLSNRQAGFARAAIAEGKNPGGCAHYLPVVNNGRFNGNIRLIDSRVEYPYDIERPSKIFLSSMSDVFHEDVPLDFLKRLFDVMLDCQRHVFQVLTKRPERVVELADEFEWPSNIWLGVSIESPRVYDRIDALNQTPAALRFLSVEPLLHAVPDLPLDGIDWTICGGESGMRARPMRAEWVRDIRDRCVARGVPFFFKQWGKLSNNPNPTTDPTASKEFAKTHQIKGGCGLDGEIWQELPFIMPYQFEKKADYGDDCFGDLLS